MKNLLYILALAFIMVSCGEHEDVIFDPTSGQTAIGFADAGVDLSVPVDGVTVTVGVISTTISDQSRTFNVAVDMENSSEGLDPADYSLGTITIPANSYEGTLDVTLNYDGLEDFVQNTLVINMDVPEEVATLTSSVTITFLREFDIAEYVCASDYEVSILLDNWGSETTWEIVDDSGAVIATGGPYTDGTAEQVVSSVVALPTGCYSFTIFDAYGDGLFDGTTTGTYEVNCEAQSVVKYVTGSGNFGDSETTDFCVN